MKWKGVCLNSSAQTKDSHILGLFCCLSHKNIYKRTDQQVITHIRGKNNPSSSLVINLLLIYSVMQVL